MKTKAFSLVCTIVSFVVLISLNACTKEEVLIVREEKDPASLVAVSEIASQFYGGRVDLCCMCPPDIHCECEGDADINYAESGKDISAVDAD